MTTTSIISGIAAWWLLIGGLQAQTVPVQVSNAFLDYELSELEIVRPVLVNVKDHYVDPDRIDLDAMLTAALEGVERAVPECMFTRRPGESLVSVEIGAFHGVREIHDVASFRQLVDTLREFAELLQTHLPTDGLPASESGVPSLARVEYAMVNGMLSTLDPHSVLLPPEIAEEVDEENQGEVGGVGLHVLQDPDTMTLRVERVLVDGPAARAGVRGGDHILRVDGESTLNMPLHRAVDRLRGPVDTKVELEISRGAAGDVLSVTVQRRNIDLRPVQSVLLGGTGIGYISIRAFHDKVAGSLSAELARLHRDAGPDGLGGLVLDMRGNPGGYLNQAVAVADRFLDTGDIVSTVVRYGRSNGHRGARATSEPFYPMVVLVDAASASASEIVAGALRYNGRAVIVGERTYGKGSVQNLYTLGDRSKLKLTFSRYLMPGNRSIQSVGIPADLELMPAWVPDDPLRRPRLFARTGIQRESDHRASLPAVGSGADGAAYALRYLHPEPEQLTRRDLLDLSGDYAIEVSRDMLKAAQGWRRADVLAAAGTVIERHRREGDRAIVDAFSRRGVDWSDGEAIDRNAPNLEVVWAGEQAGTLVAGASNRLRLRVTNPTTQALARVALVAQGPEILAGREFIVGRLEPDASVVVEQEVDVPVGWPAERVDVVFQVRDAGADVVSESRLPLEIRPAKRPHLAWRWRIHEVRGDGDGNIEAGERVGIDLEMENRGKGPSVAAFARLTNLSGASVDLVQANLAPTLEPGASWSGQFLLDIHASATSTLPLRLVIGDQEAYDVATVDRGHFHDWYAQREELQLKPGQPATASGWRVPSTIDVVRQPALTTEAGRASLSGSVQDDRGVRHVLIYAGNDKVFFDAPGVDRQLKTVFFAADVDLEPGSNLITVLTKDNDGLTSSRSFSVWSGSSALARVDEEP